MAWIVDWHRWARAALHLRRAATRARGEPRRRVVSAALLAEITRAHGVVMPADLARAVLAPPGGRLPPHLLAWLAARHLVAPELLARTLFPSRREGAPP
jgi:hypothetical protein